MDVMGIAGGISAQQLQSVQNAAGMKMLSKSMEQGEQAIQGVMQGMEGLDVKAAELSVKPHIGANFDASI